MKIKFFFTLGVLNTCFCSAFTYASTDVDHWKIDLSTVPTAINIVPYVYDLSDQPSTHVSDWTNNINGLQFNQLITFTAKLRAPLQPNTELTLKNPTSDTTDDCAELFFHNEQAFVPLNQAINLSTTFKDFNSQSSNAPIHLTAIPYKKATSDVSCVVPNSLSGNKAIAIWISNAQDIPDPNGALTCTYKPNSTITSVDDLPLTPSDDESCKFVRPQWSMIKGTDSTGKTKYYLKYSGTMAWMIAQKKPIVIHIPQDDTIPFPITTEYVKYPTGVTTDDQMQACNSDLATYNALSQNPFTDIFPDSCKLDSGFTAEDKTTEAYQRSYTYSEPMAYPIYIEGLGRIDGTAIIHKYANNPFYKFMLKAKDLNPDRPCYTPANLGSIEPCFMPGLPISTSDPTLAPVYGYVRFAQWRIDTSLLGLSSTYHNQPANASSKLMSHNTATTDPAIYINGITVSNPPKRNRSVVQLDVPQFGLEAAYGGREADNSPVFVNDFKEVGAWMDATDGPDIASDNAVEQYLYYQINDDSAKLEAKHQLVDHVTLLQGGVGGIMLGMYGVTRDGIDYSSVNDVSVPRLIQEPNKFKPWASYGSTHGLVSTRTCPRYFQNGDTTVMPSLGKAAVNNVHVFALSSLSTSYPQKLEPNTLDSLVSVGIAAGSEYCSTKFDSMSLAPTYTFGPFNFWNIVSDIPAANPFILYNNNPVTTKATWKTLDLGSANANGSTVNSLNGLYSYLCPFTGGQKQMCMMYRPSTQQSNVMSTNISNVTYLPEESDFPADKTTFIGFPYQDRQSS